jgi:permuted papain-like amidase YaeF/Yiix C92 family enzyme
MLNESDPTLGLVSGSYADFKFRWLNVARAAEYSAFTLFDTTFGGKALPGALDDSRFILNAGAGSGTQQTLANAGRIVQTAMWTPIPQGIQAAGSGPEKPPPRPPYITKAQIDKVRPRLQPGDLIFERREWALTNVGLPGYWPHVAMYVGTPEERRRAFGADFESKLRARNAGAYDARWSRATVVEALGEGVIANTFEHSAHADSVAIVRPLVAAARKADAIARAFQYVGRPYDFEFDFATDDRIVCTELVYKSYEGWLHLPVMRLAGRSVTPANDYVRWFDEQFDRARELEFVAFLDGHAQSRTAKEANAAELRSSWKRPRWHALTDRP